MDFVWIDGTGHGMTFYKPDDVIAQNSKIESSGQINDNLLYNSDFRAREGSGEFKGWRKSNEANLEFIKQDTEEGGKSALLAKNFINLDSGATAYPRIYQTSSDLASLFDTYVFPQSLAYTLSFVASVNDRAQDTEFVVVKETGRNLVLNSDFSFGIRNWSSESTQVLNEESPFMFEEPSLQYRDNNYKGWYALTYLGSNVSQELHYNLLQNGSYLLSFDIWSPYTPGSISVSVSYYNRRGEIIRDYFQEIAVNPSSSVGRYTINVPYPSNYTASDIGSIILRFNRSDSAFDTAYTPMEDEEVTVTDDYRIYISNVKLEYGTVATDWSPAKDDILPNYSDDTVRNLVLNGHMLFGMSSWSTNPETPDDNFPLEEDPTIFALQPNQVLKQKLVSELDTTATYYLTGFIYNDESGHYDSSGVTAKLNVYSKETGVLLGSTTAVTTSFSGYAVGTTKTGLGSFSLNGIASAEDIGVVELEIVNNSSTVEVYFDGLLMSQTQADSIEEWYAAPEDSGIDTSARTIAEMDNADLSGRMLATRFVVNGTEYVDYYLLGSDPTKYTKTYALESEPSSFELYFELGRGSEQKRYTSNIVLTNIKMEVGSVATDWKISNFEYDPNVERNYVNTWRDWHIVPNSRPVVNPPAPKTNYVDIPGSNNSIDLTESLTGNVKYNPREGSFEFLVDTSQWNSWIEAYTTIMNYLHGRRMDLILDDEPNYYYSGRFTVNEWKSAKDGSSITIDYVLDAFKYELSSSIDDWLWDPFNFETGIARDYSNITVNRFLSIDVGGSDMPVVPTFIVSSITDSLIVNWKGTDYMLKTGVVHVPQIVISNNDENRLIFKGNGTLSIAFKGGKL